MEVDNGRDVEGRQLGYPKEAVKEWEGGSVFFGRTLRVKGRERWWLWERGNEGNSREAMWENWRQWR